MAEIGATLREARMRARIDISEVEAQTKIRAKYLRALENEEWDLLPGPVYAKSFLRTYGDYLGVDSRALVEEFKRRYERPLEHEVRPMPSLGRERERERFNRGPLLPPWALIGVVLLAIVAALYAVGSATQSSTPSGASRAKPSHHKAHPRAHPTTSAQTTTTTPQTVTLQMVPTDTVYVCLVNGSGNKLIDEQTYSPRQTIPTETAGKLLLTLGRAGVQMKVNGQPVPVAPSSGAIRFLLTPTSVQHIPLSTQPTCP